MTVEELLRVGERRLNMLRAFNAREGIDRSADTLPRRIQKGLVGGESDGEAVTEEEIEQAKDWYYALAGWDVASGTPSRGKLEALGLDWVADSEK
jgi:aldehyde:ferredoxin oxidoreductase